jgi:ribonuclease T2
MINLVHEKAVMMKRGHVLALLAGLGVLGLGAFGVSSLPDRVTTKPSLPLGEGFDFYVLALSWSPTYCQDPQAKRRDAVQCAGPRPYAFVVHGLWPQFERGFPRACRTNQPPPTRDGARAMLDIMPSERLVRHQWENHGTCAGLSASDYLAVTRAAREAVSIPQQFVSLAQWARVDAGDVEAAFIAANPGFGTNNIAVTRRNNLLSDVRICLTRDLKPRPCPEVDRRGVSYEIRLTMPPSRN